MKRKAESSLNQKAKQPARKANHKEITEKINRLGKEILNENKLNNIIEIQDFCQSEIPQVCYSAISTLELVYSKLLAKGMMNKNQSEPKQKIATWLRENRLLFYESLAVNLTNGDLRIQVTCFEKMVKIVKEASESVDEFQTNLYSILVDKLVDLELNDTIATNIITTLNSYDDLRKSMEEGCNVSTVYRLLSSLEPHSSDITMICGTELTSFGEKTNQVKVPQVYQKVYSDCWLRFLEFPMTAPIYRGILEILHARIVPNLYDPTKLMDFLVVAYNSGGFVSILALNGLFTLIHKYNLDYPHFYPKLYALFDQNLLHAKYRSRFFRMASLFLSSTYIPSYLVSAFIKRMARISLGAPPAGIIMILPLIYNLFRLHPSSLTLIHREDVDNIKDPYIFEKLDPNESKASESCLWELELLKNHYYPTVSTLAHIFQDSLAKPSYDLEDFLDYSYSNVIPVLT
ncbi:hypothetical protein HK103_004541 [Boothiomyces macroporosus]|uniref:CCAAT-binding factor domain-containing protein n=1 Tax=Boothiomyces macroporosus TaxID=261099 RepID=A0AAD5UH14_9FUNG|nr:hypothetical protein HK103_004541 [Boothiomyces macroporosus]